MVLSRGKVVIDGGKFLGQLGRGKLLKRRQFSETDSFAT